MTRPSSGARHRSRKKLRQKPYHRPTITKFLKRYADGQRVVIVQEPSSDKGRPHHRFKGKSGVVIGARGKSYIVEIRDGNKVKRVVGKPEHLRAA